MRKKPNKLTSVIIMLLLGVMYVIASLNQIFNRLSINISNSNHIVGQVIYADTRQIKRGSFKYHFYWYIYYFKLNNSRENFAVHRSSGSYSDLTSKIAIGDILKVYFHPSGGSYNSDVFQIEKGEEILEDYHEYKKDISYVAGFGLLAGIVLITASVCWYKNISLLKILTVWIER